MKNLLYLVFGLIAFISDAQTNLVSNASFEDISDCPTAGSQILLATGWFSPNLGTPDLYNGCAIPYVGPSVPYNPFSIYRKAKSGVSYAGIYTYYTPGFNYENREYLATKLKNRLKKNKSYYFRFYCVTRYYINGTAQCFSDAIGMAVTQEKIEETQSIKRLELKPVAFNKGKILDDTTGWTKISNIYYGNNENYVYVGSFEPNATTLNTKESCEKGYFGHSYYFVDDVGIYEYNPLPDTLVICAGQSKQIGGQFLDATYKWNTGATDSIITINKPGQYILSITLDGKYQLADTIYVLNPERVVASFVTDTSFCKLESLNFPLPNIGTYQWSNASKNNVFYTKSAGNYQITVTTECGIYEHNINVKVEDCSCNIYIPNVFSPNGDQINDELNLYVNCGINFRILRFQVYDRWGNQVYISTDVESSAISWNGTFRGEPLESSVYTYTLEYEYLKKSKLIKETKSSDFTLIR